MSFLMIECATHYSPLLLTTHHSLLIAHHSLFIAHHSLLIAHHSLLTTHYSLRRVLSTGALRSSIAAAEAHVCTLPALEEELQVGGRTVPALLPPMASRPTVVPTVPALKPPMASRPTVVPTVSTCYTTP